MKAKNKNILSTLVKVKKYSVSQTIQFLIRKYFGILAFNLTDVLYSINAAKFGSIWKQLAAENGGIQDFE